MISRRNLLRSLGLSAAAAPFVPLLESVGRAQPAAHPLRIVFFFEFHGGFRPAKSGTGSETSFTLNEAVRSLEPFQDQLLLLDGLDYANIDAQNAGQDHHSLSPSVLTGQLTNIDRGALRADPGARSVDQIIGDRVGADTVHNSIYLSAIWGGGDDDLVCQSPGTSLNGDRSVRSQFDGIFGGFMPPSMTSPSAPTIDRQGSMLDTVNGDLSSLLRRVSGRDRLKVEAHLESLRSLERRVMAPPPPVDCALPERSDASGSDMRGRSAALIDMAVAALTCDLTRVAVMHYSADQPNWLGDEGHHGLTHANGLSGDNDSVVRTLIEYDSWYVSQYAELARRLSEIPEGDGTMLDNTILVWCEEENNFRNGSGIDTHNPFDVPWMIVGGRNAGLRLGRKLDYGGRAHNDLLLTFCHLMGLTDIQSIGLPEVNSGPITNLV